MVTAQIGRGTVEVNISRISNLVADLDTQIAKNWVQQFQKLANQLSIKFDLSLTQISQCPGVIINRDPEVTAKEKGEVFSGLQKALLLCNQERDREGLFLSKELSRLLTLLKQQIHKMTQYAGQADKIFRQRMTERLERMKVESVDPQRLTAEIALQLDKTDITEEIARLKEHIDAIGRILKERKESVGKKLDFFSQELLREANTIGSKSNIVGLTHAVVESKALIEKFKEQIQNVE